MALYSSRFGEALLISQSGERAMWKFLRMFSRVRNRGTTQINHSEAPIPQISVNELAALCYLAFNQLIIFDLRTLPEIEAHPYMIPGALLTNNVDLYGLIPWIPRDTIVILYASLEIPAYYARAHLPPAKLRFYALEGGLRVWRDSGQPL